MTALGKGYSIDKFSCNGLTTDNEQNKIGEYLVAVYRDADEEIYLLDEEERQFFRDYANLDSSKKSQLKGYMDRIQNEKKKMMVCCK